ncbi:MAG: AAA family ATPase [Gammaproteobacteria bacterium]|nr:AAA family ATPase [Gammaproteobacteria bacterium]
MYSDYEYGDDGYSNYYGQTRSNTYYGNSDGDDYGYNDSDEATSIATRGDLITNPKKVDTDQDDHHNSGSYIFNGIVLKWSIDDIVNNRLRLLRSTEQLPSSYEEFSSTVKEEYYEDFKPYILEDARATIASGFETSVTKYRFTLTRDVKHSRDVDNPSRMDVDQDLLKDVEGKSRVAVILSPSTNRGVKILGLASQQGFGNQNKKTTIKFIADENTRYSYKEAFVKDAKWTVFVLGSVLSHERMYEVCCIKPEVTFLPQIIQGRIPRIPEIMTLNQTTLNDSQFKAIDGFTNAANGIYLLQGPPGTGKTSTIVELIQRLVKQNKRVLICAPSNKAVQVIAERFYQKYQNEKIAIILAGVESKLPDSLTPIFLHTWVKRLLKLAQDLKVYAKKPEGYVKQIRKKDETQIVISFDQESRQFSNTKKELLRLLEIYKITQFSWQLNAALQASETYFQYLERENTSFWESLGTMTNEEANVDYKYQNYLQYHANAQQSWTNLIAAITSEKDLEEKLLGNAEVLFSTLSVIGRKQMRQTKKIDILIVDEAGQSIEAETLIPLVLQPSKCLLVGDTKQLPATVISQLAEEKEYGRSMMYRLLEDCKQPFHMLDTQYRMHSAIRHWPSLQFYQNQIMDGPNIRTRQSPFPTLTSQSHQPYAFIQTIGQESLDGTSFCNQAEANLITKFIAYLSTHHKVNPKTQIGVISFYSGQVRLLQQRLAKQYSVKVNTVDGFQGDENEIIIISFVRSNPKNSVGFLRDFRRLNVAITRGKHAVIMFGDVKTLQADRNLRSLLQHLERQHLIFSQAEFEESLQPEQKKEKPAKQLTDKSDDKKPTSSQSQPPNYKTILCKNFKAGGCKKGDKCTYAHGENELIKLKKSDKTQKTNPEKPQASATADAPKKAVKADKKPSKEAEKQSMQPDKFKTAPCKNFKVGKCTFGDKCNFAHGKDQLVKPQKSKTDSTVKSTDDKTEDRNDKASSTTQPVRTSKAYTPATVITAQNTPNTKTATAEKAQDIAPAIVTTLTKQSEKKPPAKPAPDPYSLLKKYSTIDEIVSTVPPTVATTSAKQSEKQPATKPALDPYSRLQKYNTLDEVVLAVPPTSVTTTSKQYDKTPDAKPAPDPYSLLQKYGTKSSGSTTSKPPEKSSAYKITSSEIPAASTPPRPALPPVVSADRPFAQKKSTMVCRFFANGKCPSGEKCEMRHGETASQLFK